VANRQRLVAAAQKLAADALAGDSVRYPTAAEVPDWSPATLAAFEGLTKLERAFVEWYVAGKNAAEAYRLARGADESDAEQDYSRQYGYAIQSRPRVKAAVEAGLKDRNFGARSDLEWKLAKLRAAIEKCERSNDIKAQVALGGLIHKMAELQGEVRPTGETDGGDQRGGVRVRILEILADADRLVGSRKGPDGGPPDGPNPGPARPAVGAD
jgi:hypothetical protein